MIKSRIYKEAEMKPKPLICSHQGYAGGNISYNSFASHKAAIALGADIIEFDVSVSKDKKYYIFHSDEELIRLGLEDKFYNYSSDLLEKTCLFNMNENRTKEPAPKLGEFITYFGENSNVLFHIDHAFRYDIGVLEELDRYKKFHDRFMIKVNMDRDYLDLIASFQTKFMIIAIVSSTEDIEIIKSYGDRLNVVCFEYIFKTLESPLLNREHMRKQQDAGYSLLVNGLKLNEEETINGDLTDDISILEGPKSGWGRLIDYGFDVIQTDHLVPLINFIKCRNR